MFSKRKGFTLVELMIVIVVVGILAGVMMLSSGSATDSALASEYIQDLRNAKAAAQQWFNDHLQSLTSQEIYDTWSSTTMKNQFYAYMDNTLKVDSLVFAVIPEMTVEAGTTFIDFFLVGKSATDNLTKNAHFKALGMAEGSVYSANGTPLTQPATAGTPEQMYMRAK